MSEFINQTLDKIAHLEPNQIFVFGSNTEGRHGAGTALLARQKFGALYGQSRGRQGQSYAIVTKDLAFGFRSVSLDEIAEQIDELFEYAREHSELEFLVTKIGCGLSGYTVLEIASCFYGKEIPENVRLPREFLRNL